MKVISFLGTANYTHTNYQFGERSFNTQFFTESVPYLFDDVDCILLFATEQVRQHQNLAELQQRLGERMKVVPIPDGRTEAELWGIFRQLTESIEEGERVIFDITNSFRSIPFLVFLAAAYLRAARGVKVERVIYGAYEGRDTSGISPVFDLTPFVNLLDWISATRQFITTGLGEPLSVLIKDSNPELSLAVRRVSQALALSRPLSTMIEAEGLTRALASEVHPPIPFGVLADTVRLAYADIALATPRESSSTAESLKVQSRIAKWYLDRQHYVHAATLAREVVVSLTAHLLHVNAKKLYNEYRRQEIERAINALMRQSDNPQNEQASHDLIALGALPQASQITAIWKDLTKVRNDLAHPEMRERPMHTEALIEAVTQAVERVMTLADDALAERCADDLS